MDFSLQQRAVFRNQGDFWVVGLGQRTVNLKASKGFVYLAQLLRNPGVEIHVFDLVGDRSADSGASSASRAESSGLSITGLGDAGEILDAQSKAAYRERLTELHELLTDAKRRNDFDLAVQTENEIEALSRELSRAITPRGRHRRASSAAERARVSVNKAIRHAIDRIGRNDVALAQVLSRTISTGTFCSYVPDPHDSLDWDLGDTPTDSPDSAAALLRIFPAAMTEFVGREGECDRVMAAFDQAVLGNGSVILLGGGPGIGKTRIATETARRASGRGATVLFGRCYDSEQQHPLSPFTEMIEMAWRHAATPQSFRRALGENAAEIAQAVPRLRQLFPDLAPPMQLPPEQSRRFLFEAICNFLERLAVVRPLFLVLDDLHWGDDSTLALVLHLLRRVGTMRIAMVVTTRDDEADRSPAFSSALEQLVREGVRRLRIQGLTKPAVSSMIRALANRKPPARLVETIHHETGGNPFFVEELFKYLNEEGRIFDASGSFAEVQISEVDVPENIRLIVGRRLDRLSEAARNALAAAAAIGRSFDFRLLESVASERGEPLLAAIEEGLKSGLITANRNDQEDSFSFSHELVRQTVLSRIAGPRRRRLHRDVANAIELAGPQAGEDRAAEVAHHLVEAGSEADPAKAARYLMLAGKRSIATAAHEEACRCFDLALARSSSLANSDRAELLANAGMADRSLGRWDEALAHWRESLELYWALGDHDSFGHLSVAIVETLGWAEHYLGALSFAFQSEQKLRGTSSVHRARLLGTIGSIHAAAGSHQMAQEAITEAVAIAESSHQGQVLGEVLFYRCFLNGVYLRFAEAIDDGQKSARLLRPTNAQWSLAQVLSTTQTMMFNAGRLDESESIGVEVEPLATRIGHHASLIVCLQTKARREFSRIGDIDALERWVRQELEIRESIKLGGLAPTLGLLAQVDFLRGNWNEAIPRCEQVTAAELPNAYAGLGPGLTFRQMAYLGRRDEALALLEGKRALLPQGEVPATMGPWAFLMLVLEGLHALNERELLATLYPLAQRAANSGACSIAHCNPRTMAAVAAAAARRWNDADEHFAAARQFAEHAPDRLLQIEVRRYHAQMLFERGEPGDRERAARMLVEALDGYMQMGMRGHAQIVRGLVSL